MKKFSIIEALGNYPEATECVNYATIPQICVTFFFHNVFTFAVVLFNILNAIK